MLFLSQQVKTTMSECGSGTVASGTTTGSGKWQVAVVRWQVAVATIDGHALLSLVRWSVWRVAELCAATKSTVCWNQLIV